jgi:ssDNA-binding Zn-finger/Zn-ribbon topoisomerase 1
MGDMSEWYIDMIIDLQAYGDEYYDDGEYDVCPQCGGHLIEREGKYGSFFGCSNYPKCKYTERRD